MRTGRETEIGLERKAGEMRKRAVIELAQVNIQVEKALISRSAEEFEVAIRLAQAREE